MVARPSEKTSGDLAGAIRSCLSHRSGISELRLAGCRGGAENCQALRAGGIEVFLDQSELRGGDAWDQRIRREIHDCALFIPVISVNTVSRREGYFRLEWDLADQRNHRMARETTEEGNKLEVED